MNTADTHSPGNAAGTRVWGAAAVLLAAAAAAVWGLGGPTLAVAGLALLAAFAVGGGVAARRSGHRADAVGALLRRAADADADGCFVTAAGGAVTYANTALRRLIPGLPADPLSVAHIAAAFADDAVALLAADVGAGGAVEVQLQGTDDWRRVSARRLDGGAVWRLEDITDRRRREAARRREDATIADYLDTLPAGFFAADNAGRLLYVNRTLAGWLGVEAETLCGGRARFADFVVAFAKSPEAAADGAGPDGALTLRGTGGEAFEAVVMRASPAGDGDGSRSVVLRQEAESGGDALKRFRWLFDAAPIGIVLLDLGGTVSDCNRAFLKLLGRHRDGVVGRPVTDLVAKEDRGDLAAQLSKVVMGTTRGVHLEVRLPGSGGRELAASLHAGAVVGGGGDMSGLALHFIDTTEYKNLEVQFAQSQKIQAVGQLAGGIAHDFNNLLTAMIGFSDLLLERHGPGDPSYPDIMQIRRNADRATNLVRQLLAFSRNQALEPVELDIAEALADLSNLLGRLLGETVDLRLEPGRDLGSVMVDPGQFDQTIINLAVNARDAMPRGGTLTIRTSNVAVEAPIQRGAEVIAVGDYVLIEVSDTGVGIAKENMDRIFEPFFSTKEVGQGTGLGLSTVYGIVRQTGGTILVSSAAGEGTTFAIYLPRHFAPEAAESDGAEGAEDAARLLPPPPPARRDAPLPARDLTGSGTVLLVEDEEAVRAFGARALRNKGYTVLEAENGERALDVINQDNTGPIHLIISDVVMPGMDGHTLIKLVRHELPDVKVILMSGYAEDAISEEIHRDSSVHFLPKPFTLKALAGMVKEVMEE